MAMELEELQRHSNSKLEYALFMIRCGSRAAGGLGDIRGSTLESELNRRGVACT